MKKITSFILALIIIFSVTAPAFAESEKCDCGKTPVVYVQGFGETLLLNPESEEESESVFPPEGNAILKGIPEILKALGVAVIANDDKGFANYAMKAVEKMLGGLACDEQGNSVHNVSYKSRNNIINELHLYGNPFSSPDGSYHFIYDWRLDPIYNAQELEKYIDEVKEVTGHSKVSLIAHSQGNTIIAAYLEQFGSKGIEKIAFLSPAFKGLSLMGSLFANKASIRDKGDEFADLLKTGMNTDPTGDLLAAIISSLEDIGIASCLLDWAQDLLDKQLERILQECLVDIFGTMPGLWTFVPDEFYEDAKKTMFAGNEKYNELIEKIDYYHYNVQNKTEKLIKNAMNNGVDVIISLGYGISTIPVPAAPAEQADMLIDVEYMSLGATCASPFGATFGDDYVQAEYCKGHNHVSPDLMIDASTCAFPEITWFVRDQSHSEFSDAYSEFIDWAMLYDGQPTVHTSEKYPQFMIRAKDGTLIPVDGPVEKDTRSNIHIIFASVFQMIKNSF